MRFPNAMKGIKKVYLAEVLALIGVLLAVGMLVLLAANHVNIDDTSDAGVKALNDSGMLIPFVLYAAGSVLLLLVSFILNIIGLAQASRDESSFRRALVAAVVAVAVSVLRALLQKNAVVGNWLEVVSTVCNTMLTLLVLGGIGKMADQLGNREVSALSAKCSRIVIYPLACSLIVEFLVALLSLNETTVNLLSIAIGVLDIIAYVLYLRVLSKARIME